MALILLNRLVPFKHRSAAEDRAVVWAYIFIIHAGPFLTTACPRRGGGTVGERRRLEHPVRNGYRGRHAAKHGKHIPLEYFVGDRRVLLRMHGRCILRSTIQNVNALGADDSRAKYINK